MLSTKPTDGMGQAGLDLENGEYCTAVGVAVGLVARIISEPNGAAAPEPDQIAARLATVTS